MIIKSADSESGHWYSKTGAPAYQIKGKNGNLRNTTVRDARELGLVPSVTTVLNCVSKPGLNNWLQQQVLLAALTLPRVESETEENWLARVMTDSKSTGRDAADRGTQMHGVLEDYFLGNLSEYPAYAENVSEALLAHFGHTNWECERSFAYEGFGGKVDLSADGIVVDFKSKEGSLDKVTSYHEHIMQLAAYREGLGMPGARCANVFFTNDGQVKVIEHTENELTAAWLCFQYLLMFYKTKNNI